MRMWMLPVQTLCRKHLLGEHGEIHKHRHNFVKKHSIKNRIRLGQIEPSSMKNRHDELANEMLSRGFNHKSPYEAPDISHLTEYEKSFKVNTDDSRKDLHQRCEVCKQRFEMYKVLILNGRLTSVVNETEIEVNEIKTFSILGKKDQYVKIVFNNEEILYIKQEEIEITYK